MTFNPTQKLAEELNENRQNATTYGIKAASRETESHEAILLSLKKSEEISRKKMKLDCFKSILYFAGSPQAFCYLQLHLEQANLEPDVFCLYVTRVKEDIINDLEFLKYLRPNQNDGAKRIACKRVLRRISEIFLKYFFRDYILHHKTETKAPYLGLGDKILRKITRPELLRP